MSAERFATILGQMEAIDFYYMEERYALFIFALNAHYFDLF